jgi:endo-1,4-beta-xylanase
MLLCVTRAALAQEAPKTLRQAAGDRMLIGAAVMSRQLDDQRLAKLIAEQFNCLTAENEMKPDQLQRIKGQFTFESADKIVAFAQAHDMQVIGHNLCWHQQSPVWMYRDENNKPLPREVALENLKQHIQTVVKHYKGKVKGWDVVNEALADSEPYLRDTPAKRAIGDDFVIKAFQFAHEADPDAELYYNDYNIEGPYKRDKALRLIRELKSAGVRIDGVGIQGHWLMEPLKLSEIEDGIKAFSGEGLKVMITELDVDPLPRRKGGAGADISATEREGLDPYKERLPDDEQRKLARAYGDLFRLFAKYPQVTRVTFWGTHDGTSWLNSWPVRGRTNHALLWDRQLQPKPAFDAVLQALASRSPEASR